MVVSWSDALRGLVRVAPRAASAESPDGPPEGGISSLPSRARVKAQHAIFVRWRDGWEEVNEYIKEEEFLCIYYSFCQFFRFSPTSPPLPGSGEAGEPAIDSPEGKGNSLRSVFSSSGGVDDGRVPARVDRLARELGAFDEGLDDAPERVPVEVAGLEQGRVRHPSAVCAQEAHDALRLLLVVRLVDRVLDPEQDCPRSPPPSGFRPNRSA